MKDYTIWLKSGQCMYGVIDDSAARLLRRGKFTDEEGKVTIRRGAIMAIGISDHRESTRHKDTSDVVVKGFR